MELRSTTSDDLPALRRFYARQGRGDTCVVHDNFFDWQFIFPQIRVGRSESSFLAAFDADEAVAVAAAWPAHFLLEGTRIEGCWHQEWISERPGGAAFLLMKQHDEANGFIGCAGNNLDSAVGIEGIRKFLWIEAERLFTVVDARRTLEFVFDPEARTLPFLKNVAKKQLPSPQLICKSINRFDEAYDAHWV